MRGFSLEEKCSLPLKPLQPLTPSLVLPPAPQAPPACPPKEHGPGSQKATSVDLGKLLPFPGLSLPSNEMGWA